MTKKGNEKSSTSDAEPHKEKLKMNWTMTSKKLFIHLPLEQVEGARLGKRLDQNDCKYN